MAVIKLTIGAVNITNYLIVIARKVSNPSVEAAREVYAPIQLNTALNVIIPASGTLDASIYYVDFRESTDGTTLGLLLGQFVYDAKNQRPISEVRFYQAGGPRDIDPASGQSNLVDPYLDGKNVTQVIKEGIILVPPEYDFKQFDYIPGGGVALLGGLFFNTNEIMSITITYTLSFEDSASNSGLYDGTMLISTDTTLIADHRNKRLKCEAPASRLVITLEDITTVPNSKFYQFTCNGGTQKKVKILAKSGDNIRFGGVNIPEICIGLGESVRLEKYSDDVSSYWDVINPSPFISMVGEVIHKGSKDALNALPMDSVTLFDGDDEPRIWAYINSLPSTHVETNDAVINGGFVHTAGKEGMFVKHSSQKKFRTPDTRGWYFRGMKDYATYNTDTTQRPFDYPGGTEQGAVGPHTHLVTIPKEKTSKTQEGTPRIVGGGDGNEPQALNPLTTDVPTGPGSGSKNITQNIGTIYLVRS